MEKMKTLNFLFNEKELKVYGDIKHPIFVLDDICEIIGLIKDSDLIREVREDEFYRMELTNRYQIPQYQGQQKAIINEIDLHNILFKSHSQISYQFLREINIWLEEQIILQKIKKQQQNLELRKFQKQLNKQKKFQREQEYNNRYNNKYNNRIIQFLDKRDGKLLDVIRFNEKQRIQKVQKIVHKLIGIGYSICEIDQINDLNHYRMCDAREIVSEMNKIH